MERTLGNRIIIIVGAFNSKIVLIVMPLYECFSLFVDSAESSVQNQCDSLPAKPTKHRTQNEPARFAAALFVSLPLLLVLSIYFV